jgi:hypothetical protein
MGPESAMVVDIPVRSSIVNEFAAVAAKIIHVRMGLGAIGKPKIYRPPVMAGAVRIQAFSTGC